jgi:small subunit ribosomal protein S8
MTMSDPIADYLTRIRNAIKAKKRTVDIPFSKFKFSISEILKRTGFVNDFSVIELDSNKKMISIKLKYFNSESIIEGLSRVSRPGIRRYVKSDDMPRVKNGLGVVIVSTSKGLMTEKQAREMKVGGEVICKIW